LKLAAAMVGKPDVAQRLCGSLQVDIEKTRRLLGWTPPLSLDEGLRRAGCKNPEKEYSTWCWIGFCTGAHLVTEIPVRKFRLAPVQA
jgi:hypothetical protein